MKIPGGSKYIVLPISESGELKLKKGTKTAQVHINRIISVFKYKESI